MDNEEWRRQRRKLDEANRRMEHLMTMQSKKLILDTFREVLVAANKAFITSGQSLNPSESLQAGVVAVESRMQDSHLPMTAAKLVEPDEEDPERWYRMQRNDVWYTVKACCRPCATRLLQGWGVSDHEPDPAWLVKL